MFVALNLALLTSLVLPNGAPPGVGTAHRAAGLAPRRPVSCSMLSAADVIDGAVALDTFAPQPFWLLLLAAPRAEITRKLMGPIGPIVGLSLVHLTIVLVAATQSGGTEPIAIFADVFDPSKSQLDGMQRLFEVRDFVAEEWPVCSYRHSMHASDSMKTSNLCAHSVPRPCAARAYLGLASRTSHLAGCDGAWRVSSVAGFALDKWDRPPWFATLRADLTSHRQRLAVTWW
jgi:hypothetical protein